VKVINDSVEIDTLAGELGERLRASGATIAVAESLTGGLLVQALARAEGSGDWLCGGLVAYATPVKRKVLGVAAPKVVSAQAACEMAAGVRRLLGADVAVAVTGVAGPDRQDGEPPGTVWIAIDTGRPTASLLEAVGDPSDICDTALIGSLQCALDALAQAST
jgi:nicotinamide-nucleotide amidase